MAQARPQKKAINWKEAQRKAALTARWAVTMAKVRIRRIASRTHWQLITFCGKSGGESVGVVDLLAVRNDHGKPAGALKRGDAHSESSQRRERSAADFRRRNPPTCRCKN